MYVCTCAYLNLRHAVGDESSPALDCILQPIRVPVCTCTCVCVFLSAITFLCFSSLCKAAEIYQGQDKTSDDSLFHVHRGKKISLLRLSHLPVAASPCTAYYCQQLHCQLSLL